MRCWSTVSIFWSTGVINYCKTFFHLKDHDGTRNSVVQTGVLFCVQLQIISQSVSCGIIINTKFADPIIVVQIAMPALVFIMPILLFLVDG